MGNQTQPRDQLDRLLQARPQRVPRSHCHRQEDQRSPKEGLQGPEDQTIQERQLEEEKHPETLEIQIPLTRLCLSLVFIKRLLSLLVWGGSCVAALDQSILLSYNSFPIKSSDTK